MNALVTGCAGFLGMHFLAKLENQGALVTGIDIQPGTHHSIDCRDFFREVTTPFDLVVHCAAVVPDRAEREANPMLVAENLDIDRQFFDWAIRTGQPHILYFSSSAAYPLDLQNGTKKLSEIHLWPPMARNADGIYGWSKVLGELYADVARERGVDVTVVRPFTGYGTDQAPTYPFRAIVDRAMRHEDPLRVWGSGFQSRDFVHVDDIVAICLKAVETKQTGPLNIGTGVATSMVSLAFKAADAVDYAPDILTLPDKPDGAHYRVNGSNLARHLMDADWSFITLESGITRAVAELS